MKPSYTAPRRLAALSCLLILLGMSACSDQPPASSAPTAGGQTVATINAMATATAASAGTPAPSAATAYVAVAPETPTATTAAYPAAGQLPTVTAPPAAAAAATATLALSTPTATHPAGPTPVVTVQFDSQRAMKDVEYQMSLGPRTPGSTAHQQVIDWMQSELKASGWTVELQETTLMSHPVRNVIAKRGPTGPDVPWILFGAHFDSRMKADQDPDPTKRNDPVPAANDGASGVAVMLEMARVLPKDMNQQVWLVFIDAEDQGELPGWDWLLGSRAVADSLTGKPNAVIILDMIGDANLNIYEERNSDPALTREVWDTAARLGYDKAFIAQPKWDMIDDHTPFLQKGMRAIDVIDFDYPYWHTTGDTTDKVSAQSLQIIGDTMIHWLIQTPHP